MRAYLAQHGRAFSSEEDPARPLTDQGREEIARVAGFLSLFAKPRPSRIVHSGKLRAQQTAEMFAEAWGGLDVAVAEDLAPNSDPAVWADHLEAASHDVMIVGHLPHLARLAGLLLAGDAEREPVRFRNGGVACFERTESGWTLAWHLIPALFMGED